MSTTHDPPTPNPFPHGFTRIDNRIFSRYGAHIGALGIALYAVLSFHADNVTRTCYPSTRTLSRDLGVSQRRVLKIIQVLEEAGLVEVVRARSSQGRRHVNLYTLLPIPDGQDTGLPTGNDVAYPAVAASAPLLSSSQHPAVAASAPLLSSSQHPAVAASAPLLSSSQHPAVTGSAELDLINNTQLNQRESERGRECEPSDPTPSPPAHLDHLAVKAYREVCGLMPDATQRAAIAAAVTDVAQWTDILRQWLLAGYRKQNVAGMLDWYTHGIPERSNNYGRFAGGGRAGGGLGFSGQRSGNRPGEWSAAGQSETPEERARFDAEWAAYLQASRNRSESDAA